MVSTSSKHLFDSPAPSVYIQNCFPPSSAQPGQVWFDSGAQSLKIYDGTIWQIFATGDNGTVAMNYDAEDAIDWAIKRVREEQKITELADKYPMVADALGQLEVILKLCQNLDDDGNSAK